MQIVENYQPGLICIGIVLAPVEALFECLQFQLEKTIGDRAFYSKLENIVWKEFFECDGQFYNVMRAQIAVFPLNSATTVYVCNLADGWASLFGNLVKQGALDAYFFRATNPKKTSYNVFEMKKWKQGILERQVRALEEENGWGFISNGALLHFERAERYGRRQIKARLDREMIENYSEVAGFSIASITRVEGPCWHFCRVASSKNS